MSDNWVVQNLENALNTWNEKLAEIWQLVTQSPEQFKGGTIWNVIVNIHGALQAIGLALLVLFFVVGVMRTCGNFAEVKKPEHALKLFIRFALAKGAVTYGLELMMALFKIVQGVISTIMNAAGFGTATQTVLPSEIVTAVEDCGFFESIPLWAVTLIGGLFITVLSFIMIMSVYGRFFKLYLYTAIAPVPLSAFFLYLLWRCNMNREGKKCVLYPRVSTEMQVDGYSLEGQKNGLKRFADREEMEIVGIYEDAGKSGKSIEGRPAFKKMLSDIGNGLEIDYILVYKLSRFGRNAADILNSLEYVQSYGVNLICIEEGIDSSQTSGKLLISVLSAVAEIERENIIEQTMNGRREKARQGGWNGGFAPYGYYLKDNQLLIEESEAAAIRIIFEKFAGSDIGYGGIAKYLNLQGIKKIPRQNGTLENWSGHLVRQILDNPVYCGKIAYGRRTREKVKGTKNEYKQVHAEDYILEDGQHEGIVSEELWQKVHAKRVATGIKQPSKTGKDRSHLLTGVLKCPLCGSPMYTNKHAWTNKDGTYKEVYYYICGRNKQERGHYCEYKASLRKTDIEPLVIEAIRELVSDKSFAKEIKKRFGVQTDTSKIDKELANYESKLKEVDLNKARLEREIDNLPADAKYRERKIHDMTIRLDGLYDTIVELEERIEDAKLRRSSIEMEAITLENVYRIMENFSKLYAIISDEEKKSLVSYLIKEIQIYPNGTSDRILKSIEFNFPIYRDGREIRKLLWENGNTVESICLLERVSN